MNFIKTEIPDVVIVEPRVFGDARGYFFEIHNEAAFLKAGIDARFVQDNESMSRYGVVRGLHAQRGEYAQAKLVRAAVGKVLDVAVDARPDSPTYGKWVAVELSEENKRQLFIPRGCLHGFAVLSQLAVFQYKCDNLYNKESEIGAQHDDPALGIDWRIPAEKKIVSERDASLPPFKELTR